MKTTAPPTEPRQKQAIRVLHFADAHIGIENYGSTDPETGVSSRVRDFLARMDEMIAFARDGDVDLVIFAGDAFRSRSPNQTHQREFAARIRQLSQLAPTVLLVGNHDLPLNAAKASTIEIYATLDVPNIWVAQDYETRRIRTKRGDALVAAAPYPVRARLLAGAPPAATIAERDAALRQRLHEHLQRLSAEAEALASADTPRLLAGHFSVSGARPGSERSVMLGADVEVALTTLADARWDYIALGHIHRHQALADAAEGAPPVVYSGSLERIDFSEEGQAKGFCWVELARGAARWRFVPVQARQLLSLELDCRAQDDPTAAALKALRHHELSGSVLRLALRLSAVGAALLNERQLVAELKRAGVAHVAGIQKLVERAPRARLGERPEGLGALELLERYFARGEVDAARREELLALAREIVAGGGGDLLEEGLV